MDSQIDKDRWTVRQTKTDGQSDRQRQMDRPTDGEMDRLTDGQSDRQTDRWADGKRIRPEGRLTDREDYTRS